MNFNSHHGCLKCCTIGIHSTWLRCTIFPKTKAIKRTDVGFRARLYEGHHRDYIIRKDRKLHKEPIITPLLRLPIDMVEDVTIADSLHLLHLGVIKRLKLAYKDGHVGCDNVKWTKDNVQQISQIITRQKLPVEIHRAVRGLEIVCHWKGSEYATQRLLYIAVSIKLYTKPLDIAY